MKKIKCLALSMAIVMGASMVTGNFVSASGTPSKAGAEMKSAMSGDARYSRLSRLIENIKEHQEHYRFVRDTVQGKIDVKIPGFSEAKEKEYAENMAKYSKELLELATSFIQSVNPKYVAEIAHLFENIECAQKRMEEAAPWNHIMDSRGYADSDDPARFGDKVDLNAYDSPLYPESHMSLRDFRLEDLNTSIDKMLETAEELLKIVEKSSVN